MNKEKEQMLKGLKAELEFYKKKQLLAVIFFDGENRTEINFWKKKRKEAEEAIKALEVIV